MQELLHEHWRFLIGAYIAINIVGGMPSPGNSGPTSSWGYKWAFASLHTIAAGIPRIIYTMLPQFAKFLPGNGNPTADSGAPTSTTQPPAPGGPAK
jgi:hypothetical protein